MRCSRAKQALLSLSILGALPVGVLGGDVLSTIGYTTCLDDPRIQVNAMNIQYDRSTGQLVFDVAGTSSKVQNVTASMIVTAYGKQVYNNTFNPCDEKTYMQQLCPVPAGEFAASGTQDVGSYATMIPSIAFTVPDLDGQAKLELKTDDGQNLACIESSVGNGKTMNIPAVKYVAAGIAASALVVSGLTALGNAGHPGASSPSPSFGETIGWFQGIATNGMLSASYPSVYRSFSNNFGFSTGLIPWGTMQTSIDSFRASTGGNLTDANYQYLQNVTLVETSNGNSTGGSIFKRGLGELYLWARDLDTSVNGTSTSDNGTSSGNTTSTEANKAIHYVSGIQAYVEELMIPQANTFMTVLLFFAIIISAITVLILLTKVILEAVALTGSLSMALERWRKRYWWRLAKTITNLVLLLYGTWTLYCVYQFTNGDSWGAKALAAVTWALFTSLLAVFSFKIWSKVRQSKAQSGDASALFESKENWIKYSLFYDSLKKGYWWLFVPAIIYMFARNAVIAAANGHGMVQAIGQIIVEVVFLALLIWTRPYSLKSGNVINIVIQVIRVLSVICVLVFVEELGISQTTKTVTGIILIVVQSVLTGVLAILIAVNAIIACVKENPHRRRRKDAEKLNRDLDNLTPLDARNSLLLDNAHEYKGLSPNMGMAKAPLVSPSLHVATTNTSSHHRYESLPENDPSPAGFYSDPELNPPKRGFGHRHNDSHENLVSGAASMGGRERSQSPQPRLPDIDFGHGRTLW